MDYMPAHDGSLAQDSKPEPIEVNPPTYVMMGGGYSGSGDQADLDNHANQCNPNNDEYNGYQDNDDSDDSDDNAYSQADLDNHANQLNPNNDLYQGDDDDVDDDDASSLVRSAFYRSTLRMQQHKQHRRMMHVLRSSWGLLKAEGYGVYRLSSAYDATVAMTTEVGIGATEVR
eukprot:CAMPEP_0180689768 /NCGR_PEP_ID=MMETSP1037_2-20121125/74673_1 /TAXON_ID=632150 /ORGANISM="Azadinium spinosum, Strain 3D9" /LENGTH=172 /DNA_ID=CAMNT_0022720663 /DNA_START=233 /DNA_END=750 /DNA_ORIENTATION=-